MDYEIKQLLFNECSSSLSQVTELQNVVYNSSKHRFTTESFKFWYLDNPLGNVISYNAFFGEMLVAHYACIPIQMSIEGRIVNGLLDMATVTHPDHRGKGLFKTLAKTTYDYAVTQGYEFIIGVANANSFPGYMKYFDFTFVAQLDVKVGFGTDIFNIRDNTYSMYWNEESLEWRLRHSKYSIYKDVFVGTLDYSYFKKLIGIKTLMGNVPKNLANTLHIKKSHCMLRPLNLYVGLGADLSKGYYISIPKFIKHSPFNLIFLDLTNGKLPAITKDNIFFQLIDFDVA
jgi:GNAT superfamily N-acetyltransferase